MAALSGAGRRAVVTALAEEADELQQRDTARLWAYEEAAMPYLAECRAIRLVDLPLREAHARLCEIAARRLPAVVTWSPNSATTE